MMMELSHELKVIRNLIFDFLINRSNLSKMSNCSYDFYTRHRFKELYLERVTRIVLYLYTNGDNNDTFMDKVLSVMPFLSSDNNVEESYDYMMNLLARLNDITKDKEKSIPKTRRDFYNLKADIIRSLIRWRSKFVTAWIEIDDEDREYFTLVFNNNEGKNWIFHQPERNLHQERLTFGSPLRGLEIKDYHREDQTVIDLDDDFSLKDYQFMIDKLFIAYHYYINTVNSI